jgi:hypothetical protein
MINCELWIFGEGTGRSLFRLLFFLLRGVAEEYHDSLSQSSLFLGRDSKHGVPEHDHVQPEVDPHVIGFSLLKY